MSEFTDEQITDAIAAAIRDHEFHAIEGLIRLLALQSPSKAQEVYDLLTTGTLNIPVKIR